MKTKKNISSTTVAKAISVITLLTVFCQIGVVKAADSNKIAEKLMYAVARTTTVAKTDPYFAVNSPMHSDNDAFVTSLNFTAQEDKALADSMVNSFFAGMDAADSAYKIKKSRSLGTLVVTAVCPLLTIVPVAIASSISPSAKHLHADTAMNNNKAYMKGYKYQAHYIKRRTLWGTFVGGATPWCVVVGFLLM